jgi:hypothetical protein
MPTTHEVRINNSKKDVVTAEDDPTVAAGDLLSLFGYHEFSQVLFADSFGSFDTGPAEFSQRRGERYAHDDEVDLSDTQHFVTALRRTLEN